MRLDTSYSIERFSEGFGGYGSNVQPSPPISRILFSIIATRLPYLAASRAPYIPLARYLSRVDRTFDVSLHSLSKIRLRYVS